ncbi:integrase core domain-containing protein [uncultured Ruegeria sp.]|uniref:integrase core domain-containing protein n=1 Tax=uncultured Ruegeria sp. TaxID=259304 RepID=UPI00345C2090
METIRRLEKWRTWSLSAKIGIGKWLAYYNAERPHSTHGILTPDEACANKTEPMRSAA